MTRREDREAGFTLIETIVALALMGLVLSALASVTAQWLPNWNHGIDRIQRSEVIGVALQRIGADIASAEYVPANRKTHRPLFEGSELSVTFVRTSFGPNSGPGLDVVRLGETIDHGEFVTVRSQMRFTPLPLVSSLPQHLHFADPVVLLRKPYRLSFAYAGPDRIWKSTWRDADKLPAMIRLTIRDAGSERVLAISTITPIHIQAPSNCVRPDGGCDDRKDEQNDDKNAASTSSSGAVASATAGQGATQ
ncbi:MAG: prepilin-type N-terminal cleavage/methylation domain-containing protein [Bradyrhizobium sp.]|nr:prepilin-type N-terminal cleavage/methylation domain-containing protein [Pseudomonadota bacterium]MDE2068325.1 prepilin-type N-terminal cleavage/methylation domain-containing protein [Bradyrhizobium sp.]MDE2469698.1 prepilin-type N-terminal cleavage/methylation domain-containing protein [Bradyrhizobium sp.]